MYRLTFEEARALGLKVIRGSKRLRKTHRAPSELEEGLALQIKGARLPEPEREHRFHEERLWRFDFAWPAQMVAAEVEGGTWSGGRHVRGQGFENDCEKYNAAAEMDWKVFRFTAAMIQDGTALATLERVLEGEKT